MLLQPRMVTGCPSVQPQKRRIIPGPAFSLCRVIIRGMDLRWGSHKNIADPIRESPGSLVEAIVLFAYLIIWSLTMAAFIGIFILTGVVTMLLVLVCLPCFLWSKAVPKDKSQRSGHGPKARLLG